MIKKLLILCVFAVCSLPSISQPFNNYLSLDGVDDYASGVFSSSIPNNSDFTIEAYFNVCGGSSYKLFDNRGSTAGDGVEIWVHPGLLPSIFVGMRGDDGTSANYYYSGSSVLTSVWNHIAIVHQHSDSMNFLYYNGNKIHEWKGDVNPVRSGLHVGVSDNAAGSFLKGYIDEMRFSKSARYTGDTYPVSTSEFTPDANTVALYHFNEGRSATSFADASGNNNTLTAAGGAATFNNTITVSDLIITSGNSTTLTGPDGGVSYTWSPDINLSSTTGKSVTASPVTTTTYTMFVADTNDCAVSDSVEIMVETPTGSMDINDVNQLNIYPVPAKGIITIDFESTDDAELSVINSLGMVVKQIRITSGHSLNLSDLTEGVYDVRLVTKNGTTVKRIIVL